MGLELRHFIYPCLWRLNLYRQANLAEVGDVHKIKLKQNIMTKKMHVVRAQMHKSDFLEDIHIFAF